MKTYIYQSVIALTLFLALAGFSHPCVAASDVKWVNFADLNLNKPGDVAVLYKRIQKAAKDVCIGDWPSTWVYNRRAFKRCFKLTVDKAVMRIDNTALTAMHLNQSKSVAGR